MASYVNKKDRVFYPAGDCPPQFHRQRPEACLKTYYSCTDTRVWELAEEPRRQHLRDILSTPLGLQLGNYVPIEMLINILMCSDAEVCIKEKDMGFRSVGINSGNDVISCVCGRDASRPIKTCGTQSPAIKSYPPKEDNCRMEKLENELKCAKQRFNENQKEISCLKNDLCEKSKELSCLKKELCEKSKCTAESVKKLELVNKKLHECDCERKELERKLCEQQKCLQKLQQETVSPAKMGEMQHELCKLRDYCQFLSKAQEQAEKHSECLNTENQGLKKELRACHQSLADQSGKMAELHSNADSIKRCLMNKDDEICLLKKDSCRLQEEIRYLNIKLKEACAAKGDNQKCSCSHGAAEEKAKKYKQKFKELECQLRELSCQCTKNKKEPQVECLEKERDMLSRRVEELCHVEQAYNSLRSQLCEMQNIMAERDMLRMKLLNLSSVEEELERLRFKSKESECLRAERNRLKQRNEELEAIELQYIELLETSKEIESVKCERDRLKCKVEELMRQNYEKQRQICEMETELKQLIAQIDHMTEEEAKQELKKVRDQNECLRHTLEEKQKCLKHYAEQFKLMDDAKGELKEIQDQILNSINDFNIQQKLTDNLYKSLCTEHDFSSEHLDKVIEFLTQLVACDDNQDLYHLKCNVIRQITYLKNSLDCNKEHFTTRLNEIFNLNNYNGHESIDISRSIYGNVLDETHRQYNDEINKMEKIILKYENQIESLQHIQSIQVYSCHHQKPDNITTEEHESVLLDEVTCLLLHEIEYKTDEIENDEAELNQLKSNESKFNSICDQINEIVLRVESEQNTFIDDNNSNKQIFNIIKNIEEKRNEIYYLQNMLNKMISNNESDIYKTIDEIIQLYELIENDQRNLNELLITTEVDLNNDEVLKQIRIIQKEIQLKEHKIIELQNQLKRISKLDNNNINSSDIQELTTLIKSLQNEIHIDQNEIKKMYELAAIKDNNLTSYLTDLVKKSHLTNLQTEQTINKYLSPVKKLKENITNNEVEIKKLYRLLQSQQRKDIIEIMEQINKLQNGIFKYENDILRILTNIPNQIIEADICNDIKEHIFTIQKLANGNLKAENDLNYLKQSVLDNSNEDKLNDITSKIKIIEKIIRKNNEKISIISSLLILPMNLKQTIQYTSDELSRNTKDDTIKYTLSIRTLQSLIDKNKKDINYLKGRKIFEEDQYKNQVYHLQGNINKNMKEIIKLIAFLPDDESLISTNINDLQSRQLSIFNDYTQILNNLNRLREFNLNQMENLGTINKIQEHINNEQKQIRTLCNTAKHMLQNIIYDEQMEIVTIVNQIIELLCNVENAQNDLEHCEIHLQYVLNQLNEETTYGIIDEEMVKRLENDINKFENIILILEKCKEIEESENIDRYINEIEKLQNTIDQLQRKLEESENMVVYIDEIKKLHKYIEELERENRMKINLKHNEEITKNYLQKLTHVVDKLHTSKASIIDSNANATGMQIEMPTSLDDHGIKKLTDIPFEVYNLKIDNAQLKTTQEELMKQIKENENEKKQFREEIDALQLKHQNAIQDLESCIQNSKQCEDEKNELRREIAELKRDDNRSKGKGACQMNTTQTDDPKDIEELEKRIENYAFIIDTVGKDGHYSHMFAMMGEAIQSLDTELRKAHNQIALLRWNALVDENLTKMAKHCLKELHDKLDDSKHDATIKELMKTIGQLENKIQTIKAESKMNERAGTFDRTTSTTGTKSDGNPKTHYITYKSKGENDGGLSTQYSDIDVQTTSMNMVTSNVFIQTDDQQLYKLYSLSKNYVLSLDIESQENQSVMSYQPGESEIPMTEIIPQQNITNAHVQLNRLPSSVTDEENHRKIQTKHKNLQSSKPRTPQINVRPQREQGRFDTPTNNTHRVPWSFKSMVETGHKTPAISESASIGSLPTPMPSEYNADPEDFGRMAGGNLPHDSPDSIYKYPYTNQSESSFITPSTRTSALTIRHDSPQQITSSVRGCANYLSPSKHTTQHYSYRGSHRRSYDHESQDILPTRDTENMDLVASHQTTTYSRNLSNFDVNESQVTSFEQNSTRRLRSTSKPPTPIKKNVEENVPKYKSRPLSAPPKSNFYIQKPKHTADSTPANVFTTENTTDESEYEDKNSHRGVSTSSTDMAYFTQMNRQTLPLVLNIEQQEDITDPSISRCASYRGSAVNNRHYTTQDSYSLRGVPKHSHSNEPRHYIHDVQGQSNAMSVIRNARDCGVSENQNNYASTLRSCDKKDLKRYINLGGIYSSSKNDISADLPMNVEDSKCVKDSYLDKGIDETPIRRSSSPFDYPMIDAFTEVAALKKKLADFEDRAAHNLANLKKQYERNARSLIDEHNKSVSKLSGMQDDTIRKLEIENDELRDQVQELLTTLTDYENKTTGFSSTSTGKIDIPPSHKKVHALHLQNDKSVRTNKMQDGGKSADDGEKRDDSKDKNVCELKKVMICDHPICCHDDDESCVSCKDCEACLEDCDGDCTCFVEKAVQTKPMPRPKIAATRSMACILNKFLYEGLQRLDICELSKLHSRVCYAATVLIEEDRERKMSQEEKVINKIKKMEEQLVRKQRTAREKLQLLEICMKQEKQRICVMRAEVECEKRVAAQCKSPSFSLCSSEKPPVDQRVCQSIQVCPPAECSCKAPPCCPSNPCKPKSILKVCSDPCKPKACSSPCTTPSTINLCSKCKPKIFPCCKPMKIVKICSDPCAPMPICPDPCKPKKSCSDPCRPSPSCRPCKSTSVLCQDRCKPKICPLSCGPRSTSMLCESKPKLVCQSTSTTDNCSGCGTSICQSIFPTVKQATKYKIDDKSKKEDKPKECSCVSKNKSHPATTKTCCVCCDNKASCSTKDKKENAVPSERQTQKFVNKCAHNFQSSASRKSSL